MNKIQYDEWEDRNGRRHTQFYTINGERQERPCDKYPYSFSRYCVWKSDNYKPSDNACYSDRIGISKYWFEEKDIDQITSIISEKWCGGKEVELTGVELECNASTGYPYMILYFRYLHPEQEE